MRLKLTTVTVAKLNFAVAAAVLTILSLPAGVSVAGGWELKSASVSPTGAYFAGKPLRIELTTADERERSVSVSIIHKRTRKIVKRWSIPTVSQAGRTRLRWGGATERGAIARNGAYAVRAGPEGRPSRRLGKFIFRRHAYPVDGPHADRGHLGQFGDPRSGGRTHEGFDINAACGTPIVAARGGKVLKSRFDSRLKGNHVVIDGRRDRFRYVYAHLRAPSKLKKGDRARTNQLIGHVGQTGNAAGTPCHLHIELRDHGPVDPEPYLRRWER